MTDNANPTPEDIENEVYYQLDKHPELRKTQGPGRHDTVALVPFLYDILVCKYKPAASDIAQGKPFYMWQKNKLAVGIVCYKEKSK